MSATDPNEMAHHAARMLENPAWRALIEQARAQLARERDALALDAEARKAVSIAESVLTRIERRAALLAQPAALRDVNQRGAA